MRRSKNTILHFWNSLHKSTKREAECIRKSPYFNEQFYIECNPDVNESGIDPALHFLLHGAREQRDPSPDFSVTTYLRLNPDVASAGINALLHYELHGRREGRPIAEQLHPVETRSAQAGDKNRRRRISSQIPTEPACDNWGFSRGLPIDRYYIDAFLSRHASDIRGTLLEIGDDTYIRRFGGDQVTKLDVLDINPENTKATILADLMDASSVPSDTYDCIIITQVMELIRDLDRATSNLVRITKPGGVILCTAPSISRVSGHPPEKENWYWSLYPASARLLFTRPDIDNRTLLVESWGNLRTATAFLWGLAQEDLTEDDFLLDDPRYPLVTTIRAVKRSGSPG